MRPHVKTHKSCRIADLQLKAGAKGLTVAKPEEAIAFMQCGVSSIKICYPIISEEKIEKILRAAKINATEILFVLDSMFGFFVLEKIAAKMNQKIKVFVEIDVGLNRCGLSIDDPVLVEIAQKINGSGFLCLTGITSHAGQCYGAKTSDAVLTVANQEREIMNGVKEKLISAGIAVDEVCVGATPTLWVQTNFKGITEIKPGNYVFNDLTQKSIGVVDWGQLALSVVTTVVSVNNTYLIVDAGSKSLSSDIGAHGTQGVKGYGIAFPIHQNPSDHSGLLVKKLSEEHGWIEHKGKCLPIGTKIRIFPNHSCSVVNLFDEVQVFEDEKFVGTWPVDARGCVH